MKNSLYYGVKHVLIANIINLSFSLLTSFLLPKYLSTDSYATIKTYQLFISYSGIMHLGYIDGMYLKFGGKKLDEIDRNELRNNFLTLQIFQVIITIILIVIGLYINDYIFLAFALSILPLNMISYFKSMFQAAGEFNRYGKILNINTICTFIINISLLFIFKVDNYIVYLFIYVILDVIIWFLLENLFYKNSIKRTKNIFFSAKEFFESIKLGFFLMCGNFSSLVLTTMDRWFVKVLMNSFVFSQYSFAVSMENFLNVAITPITVTLYNYFCKHTKVKELVTLRNYVMIFSSFIVICAFPAKFILEIFLNNYISSSNIMFLLFSAQIFNINLKSIYVNLYKAKRMQNLYFIKLVIVIFLGFFSNLFLWNLLKTKESFAIGTLFSTMVWYFISLLDFRELNKDIKVVFYPLLSVIAFLLAGICLNSVIGFFTYMFYIIILTIVTYKNECKRIYCIIKQNICST